MISFNINQILEEKGKTCYWLAKQCNMSPNNMAKICNGETTSVRLETLEKICKTLECTPNDIIKSNDPQMNRLLAYRNELNKLMAKVDTKGGTIN